MPSTPNQGDVIEIDQCRLELFPMEQSWRIVIVAILQRLMSLVIVEPLLGLLQLTVVVMLIVDALLVLLSLLMMIVEPHGA